MASESALTVAEKDSLEITHFIFHIIIAGEDEPEYLEEVEIDVAQKQFFKDRIIDASSGTQYVFTGPEQNNLRTSCVQILDDPGTNYLTESKKIAASFLGHHSGRMSDGVLIISRITIVKNDQLVPMVSLIKMDHQRVLQYSLEDTDVGRRAVIEEITNSFVEDKSAMQKVALIDIGKQYAWDVIARERGAAEGVAEYFRRFLGTTERESASVLTKKAVQAVRNWAVLFRQDLPDDMDPTLVKSRAVTYMNTHDTFNTDSFLEMLVSDDDQERKAQNLRSLREHLEAEGIAGQTFATRPAVLTRSVTRNKYSTEEGVKIEFDGAATARGVSLPKERDDDGYFHIDIKTREFSALT